VSRRNDSATLINMNIAIFSDNFYPELSGISDMVMTLSRELGKRGHLVRLYVPQYAPRNFRRVNVPVQEIDLGNNVSIKRLFSIPFPTGTKQGRMIVPMGAAFRDLKKFKPDILHTQLFFGAGFEALHAAKKLQVPLVGTNHTVLSEFVPHIPIFFGSLVRLSLKFVSWFYNHSQVVTAPSRTLLEEMIHYGMSRPSSLVDNPIDLDQFRVLPVLKKPASLVFAGRLSVEKNISILIQALPLILKKVPEATLFVAGHGPEKERLQHLAFELSISASVKFLGTLSKPALTELYNQSEIFVTASTSENQPLTLLQAFACGIPAVGVNARGLGEHILPTCGRLVEPANMEAFAEAVITLLQNPSQRAAYGENAVEYVQQFRASVVAQKWEEVYQSLL